MIWLLLIALVSSGPCHEPASLAASSPSSSTAGFSSEEEKLWLDLLDCSLLHTPACRALLESVASETKSAPHGELASILLEEWDLDPSDPSLSRARRISVPLPPFDELQHLVPEKVKPAVLVVSGIVRTNGIIEDLQLLRGSEYDDLNQAILKAFSEGKYRPARDGERFVSQRVEFLYRLDPR